MIHPRTKDMIYSRVPMAALQLLLPRVAASKTPFTVPVLTRQVIFIHVPKAAGSSLKEYIYGQRGGGHRRIAEFAAYDAEKTAQFFKCAFVRNPWDRLYSAYSYLSQDIPVSYRDRRFAEDYLARHDGFRDFVRALKDRSYRNAVMRYDHFRPQIHWICMPGARTHAMDFLGRFETVEADLSRLRRRLDLPDLPLGKTRASKRGDYRLVYDDETRDIVADLYAEDISLLNYTF